MKMSNNPAKYEVLIKQYLRSILDISAKYSEDCPETFEEDLKMFRSYTNEFKRETHQTSPDLSPGCGQV